MAPPKKSKGEKSQKVTEEKRDRRTWSDEEITSALDYLLDTMKNGRTIEKPNATAYYQRALNALKFENCSAKQLNNQIYNLKKKYTKAIEWRGKTGEGVLQNEGEDSVKRILLKMCPQFDQLDEIYGTKISIDPPFILDSEVSAPHIATGSVDLEIEIEEEQLESTDVVVERQAPQGSSSVIKKGAKRKATDGMSALAETAKLRIQVQQSEIDLNRDKFEFEKTLAERKLKLAEDKENRKLDLQEQKLRNKFELEKYKIDQECKLKLELAQLKK